MDRAEYAKANPAACVGCPRLTVAERPVGHCTKDGCTRPLFGDGLCEMHHNRRRMFGSKPASGGVKRCTVKGCQEKHEAKGLCKKHYAKEIYRTRRQAEKSLTLRFFGEETELYQRLLVSAKKRGNTVETEAKIFIEACLDHYGVK